MLSCQSVTRLLSEAQDRKLTPSEKIPVAMHLTICTSCRNFASQMRFLRQACQRFVYATKKAEE